MTIGLHALSAVGAVALCMGSLWLIGVHLYSYADRIAEVLSADHFPPEDR